MSGEKALYLLPWAPIVSRNTSDFSWTVIPCLIVSKPQVFIYSISYIVMVLGPGLPLRGADVPTQNRGRWLHLIPLMHWSEESQHGSVYLSPQPLLLKWKTKVVFKFNDAFYGASAAKYKKHAASEEWQWKEVLWACFIFAERKKYEEGDNESGALVGVHSSLIYHWRCSCIGACQSCVRWKIFIVEGVHCCQEQHLHRTTVGHWGVGISRLWKYNLFHFHPWSHLLYEQRAVVPG